AGPASEIARRVPDRDAAAAGDDLPGRGLPALLDGSGVRLAGRDLAHCTTGRRPVHVPHRRAVPRVEEARWPALGRLLAREDRLSRRHVVAALLERARDGLELLRPACAVVGAAGVAVVLECLLVLVLRLSIRLDGLLE